MCRLDGGVVAALDVVRPFGGALVGLQAAQVREEGELQVIVRVDQARKHHVAAEIERVLRGALVQRSPAPGFGVFGPGRVDDLHLAWGRTVQVRMPDRLRRRNAPGSALELEEIDGGDAGERLEGGPLVRLVEERALRVGESRFHQGAHVEIVVGKRGDDVVDGVGLRGELDGGSVGLEGARPAAGQRSGGVHVGEKETAPGAQQAGALGGEGGEIVDVAKHKRRQNQVF